MLGEAGGGGGLELLYIIQLAKGRSQGGGLKNYSIKFRCCWGGGLRSVSVTRGLLRNCPKLLYLITSVRCICTVQIYMYCTNRHDEKFAEKLPKILVPYHLCQIYLYCTNIYVLYKYICTVQIYMYCTNQHEESLLINCLNFTISS